MGNTLYEQFHNNVKGIQPLNTAKDSLDSLQSTYENVRDNMTQALTGIKATYTGNAADAMSDAFTPLANSFNDGANFAGSASLATSFQAESFATAQAKIQNQVPVPAAPWYEPVDPFSTGHDDAIQQNSQIDAANEAAYTAYGNDTNGNLGYVQPAPTNTPGFGSFSVTQQGSGTSVGSPSGTSGAPGSGGSGSGSATSRYRGTGTAPGGTITPPTGAHSSSGSSTSGGGSTPPGQTSTSSYTPPPSTGLGSSPGGSQPGGGAPGSGLPIGSPAGTGGGQFGSNGPGSVIGPVGGSGGSFGGGGSGSPIGRGGFGLTGGSEPGAGGSGAGGARSSVGSTAGVASEAELEGGVSAAGRSGASGMPGGAMGGRGRGEDDREHRTASYLTNDDNFNVIIGDFDPVAPPVIGEE